MRKMLLAASIATVLAAPTALAHDENHNISFGGDDHCNVTFENSLRLNASTIEITDSKGKTLRIDNDANLYIDGEMQSLTSAQQTAVKEYADGLRQQLPQVADIALEGVKLAGVALAEVSRTLDMPAFDAVAELMDQVGTEIHARFYDGDTFVFDQKNFDSMDEAFGPEFEAKIEQAIEENLMENIGSILVSVGSALISSGGDMNAFEQKFENMGKVLEEKMEKEAAVIEQKAEALCGSFLTLAQQENELQHLIPGIESYDLFTVKMGEYK